MGRVAAAIAAALVLGGSGATSAKTLLLIVSGVGGEESYSDSFFEWSSTVIEAAEEAGVDRQDWVYLAEDPARSPDKIQGPSRRENVESELRQLVRRTEQGDQLWVILFGHGSARNGENRFNLLGPDMTESDFAAILEGTSGRIVFVNASSASAGFVAALSSPGRAVITATRSERERHATTFGGYFAEGLRGLTADLDKDEQVSLLEAFNYARLEVGRRYKDEELLATEHPLLDDNGDGEGSLEPSVSAADGAVASRFFLSRGKEIEGASPELKALMKEEAELEDRVAELRAQKASLDEELYRAELQSLLLALAMKSEEIRQLSGENEE